MSCTCFRWAFRLSHWQPSVDECRKAFQLVQAEEIKRINEFYFLQDAKAAFIGRLMLRQAAYQACRFFGFQKEWCDLRFQRSDRGKPFLMLEPRESDVATFDLNVSHHGDFVVLALNTNGSCGVDVMKLDRPSGSRSVDEYFGLMKKQFSAQEYDSLLNCSNDDDKMSCFYRYWCLKESYIKAIGTGISSNLAALDFHLGSPTLRQDLIVNDTRLQCDDLQGMWSFEESLLDNQHVVAVCAQLDANEHMQQCHSKDLLFRLIDLNFLIRDAQPVTVLSKNEHLLFMNKKIKNV